MKGRHYPLQAATSSRDGNHMYTKVWYVLFVSIWVSIISDYICIFRLKLRHPEIWTQLGSPGFFSGTRVKLALRRLGYFYSGRFLELGDGVLIIFFLFNAASTLLGIIAFVSLETWVKR